jgi:5-methylcytosine-specific restriction endonuclease McrA
MPSGIYQHKPQQGFQKGYKLAFTPEIRKKISEAGKGRKHSEETKKKISDIQKQQYKNGERTLSFKGRKHSEETKRKMSEAHKGEKSYLWKGGISYSQEYSVDWTRHLRVVIRERDRYICQLCGELQGDYAFDVHHIDYNKLNCNPNNLITLCRSCHIKTNQNREKWKIVFKT